MDQLNLRQFSSHICLKQLSIPKLACHCQFTKATEVSQQVLPSTGEINLAEIQHWKINCRSLQHWQTDQITETVHYFMGRGMDICVKSTKLRGAFGPIKTELYSLKDLLHYNAKYVKHVMKERERTLFCVQHSMGVDFYAKPKWEALVFSWTKNTKIHPTPGNKYSTVDNKYVFTMWTVNCQNLVQPTHARIGSFIGHPPHQATQHRKHMQGPALPRIIPTPSPIASADASVVHVN